MAAALGIPPAAQPLSVDAGPTPTVDPRRLRHLGDYELMELIAEGGMGQVYRTRQRSTNRETALKILNPSAFGSPRAAQRFRNEIETVASLDHPHILPIFEAGEDGGIRFFSMRLAPGGSLAQALADGRWKPVSGPRERTRQVELARLLAAVARGVHHAHERGVIHRDLKPGNILLDAAGGPLVADFGLARAARADTDPSQTYEVLGTPAYMAPEQTRGGRLATVASDIYSLGVVLYELLTGRTPFVGRDWDELSRRIQKEEPASPTRWVPAVDRDLATICLKCLAKEPPHRYRSAAELADDLERWLRHEPVTARPLHAGQRLVRWVQRHRVVAVLVALMTGVALLGLAAVLWQWRATLRANRDLERQISVTQQTLADVQFRGGAGPQALQFLAQQVRRNPRDQASAIRLGSALVHRAWALPHRVIEIPSGAAEDMLWAPDGRHIAVISLHGNDLTRHELSLRDWRSGALVAGPIPLGNQPGELAFSPDGRWLLSTFDTRFQLFDAATLQSVTMSGFAASNGLTFAWHPDSRQALLAGGTNEAWLAPVMGGSTMAGESGIRLQTPGQILAVALSRDGSLAALGDELGNVRLRNLVTGADLVEPPRLGHAVAGLTFAPKGDRLMIMEAGGGVGLWSWPEARYVLRETNASLATFDAPGDRLLLRVGDGAQVRDAHAGQLLKEWPGCAPHYPEGFSADGRWLVLLDGTKWVRWIDATTLNDAAEPILNPWTVNSLHIAPDGRHIGLTLDRPEVEIWSAPRVVAPPASIATQVAQFWFSPGNAWLVLATESALELRRGSEPDQPGRRLTLPAPATAVAFAGSAGLLAAACGHDVGVWRLADGSEVNRWRFPTNQIAFVALAPSGEWLVTLSSHGHLDQWSVRSGERVMPTVDVAAGPTPFFGGGVPRDLAFSPRGDLFAVGCHNGDVIGFEAGTDRRRFVLHHEIAVSTLCFSPDGRRLGAADFMQSARVWDAATGRPVTPVLPHTDTVTSLDFSPDGARLLSVEMGGRAQVWDAERGTLLAACLSTNYGLVPVRFAPDGSRFAAGGVGLAVQVYDAATGLPLVEPLPVGSGRVELAWGPDRDGLFVRSGDGVLRRLEVPHWPVPVPGWVPDLAVALSGAVTNHSPARPILSALASGTNTTDARVWPGVAKAFLMP